MYTFLIYCYSRHLLFRLLDLWSMQTSPFAELVRSVDYGVFVTALILYIILCAHICDYYYTAIVSINFASFYNTFFSSKHKVFCM